MAAYIDFGNFLLTPHYSGLLQFQLTAKEDGLKWGLRCRCQHDTSSLGKPPILLIMSLAMNVTRRICEYLR
jgi:hypothetical protein